MAEYIVVYGTTLYTCFLDILIFEVQKFIVNKYHLLSNLKCYTLSNL